MVEPEMAYYDLDDNMALAEAFMEHIAKAILTRLSSRTQKPLSGTCPNSKKSAPPSPALSYDEALKVLEKHGVAIPWGEDFGAPHETALGKEFGKPVFMSTHAVPN